MAFYLGVLGTYLDAESRSEEKISALLGNGKTSQLGRWLDLTGK